MFDYNKQECNNKSVSATREWSDNEVVNFARKHAMIVAKGVLTECLQTLPLLLCVFSPTMPIQIISKKRGKGRRKKERIGEGEKRDGMVG